MWLKKYKLGTKAKTNNMGTWHVYDVSEAGDTDEADVKVAEALYSAFANKDLNFEVEGSSTAKASASADEDY